VTDQPSISSWFSDKIDKAREETGASLSRKLEHRQMKSKTNSVSCFICQRVMDIGFINLHLDECLRQSASETPPEFLPPENLIKTLESTDSTQINDLHFVDCKQVPGLWAVHNFISEAEERQIIEQLDNDRTPWKHSSFNGHCMSKSFGVKTQFGPAYVEERIVRKNDPSKGEFDIPDYLHLYPTRLRHIVNCSEKRNLPAALRTFRPNECNANSYLKAENHNLTPHFDDRHLSGPVLMNLSLGGHCRMTYTKYHGEGVLNPGASHDTVVVDLPPRCLQLVTGDARYKYTHAIKKDDILSNRRLSITWRQAAPANGGLIRGLIPNGATRLLPNGATFSSPMVTSVGSISSIDDAFIANGTQQTNKTDCNTSDTIYTLLPTTDSKLL
jgi:alkylated DNA repair dioxygenase AlkB